MSSKTVKVSSAAEFNGLLQSSKVLVVDFYADWCGPCKVIAPIFEQLSQVLSRPKLVTFVKVDTDTRKDIASTYSITSLPTFIVFRNGEPKERVEGADPRRLQEVVKKLSAEVQSLGDAGSSAGEEASSSADTKWLGAGLPRGFSDVTDQIEIQRSEILNVEEPSESMQRLLSPLKPSALSGGKSKTKDWVESDTDEQMMLFLPFQAVMKLHTLQLTSLPPDDPEADDLPLRPRTIRLFINKAHNLGFDEADDTSPTQVIQVHEDDWNDQGTATIALRYVKFQKVNSLVIFIVDGDGDGEKVRLDRVRLIGEAGEKREMGKLEKIGDLPGE